MSSRENAIDSIRAAAKILDIQSPKISFASEDKFVSPEVPSSFNNGINVITVNVDWLEKSSEIEVISTSFHETRHAYQWHCIKTRTNENINVIDQWEREFQDYKTPSKSGNPLNNTAYLSQSIEIDAIAFTYYCMNEIFDVKLFVPKAIKTQVSKKIKSFAKQKNLLFGLDMGKINIPKQTRIQKRRITCDEYYQRCLNSNYPIKTLEEDVFECIDKTELDAIANRVDWLDFSLRFQNKYPSKAEMIIPNIKWYNLSLRDDLTEEFIFRFQDYIHFDKLTWKVMTNNIIDSFGDKLDWQKVSKYRGLSKELVEKYKDKKDQD